MPEIYERCLAAPVFQPHARRLARAAAELGGSRILEVAAGTGLVTRELAALMPGRSVRTEITATDLNQSMVDFASTLLDSVAWGVADAMQLPFADSSFDLVVCQFGAMFFPDRRAAFSEVARVLAPGGAFLFNVWDSLETNPATAAVVEGLSEVFQDPPTFQRIPHGYFDVEEVLADVEAAGLHPVEWERVVLHGQSTAADIATGFCKGTPLVADIQRQGSLEEAVRAAARAVADRLGPDPVTVESTSLVFSARR